MMALPSSSTSPHAVSHLGSDQFRTHSRQPFGSSQSRRSSARQLAESEYRHAREDPTDTLAWLSYVKATKNIRVGGRLERGRLARVETAFLDTGPPMFTFTPTTSDSSTCTDTDSDGESEDEDEKRDEAEDGGALCPTPSTKRHKWKVHTIGFVKKMTEERLRKLKTIVATSEVSKSWNLSASQFRVSFTHWPLLICTMVAFYFWLFCVLYEFLAKRHGTDWHVWVLSIGIPVFCFLVTVLPRTSTFRMSWSDLIKIFLTALVILIAMLSFLDISGQGLATCTDSPGPPANAVSEAYNGVFGLIASSFFF
eukprot:TRINITY_DN14614_c0_g2_i1.p1 TRINITY_DN14614_c0_g2~~TRINITY_DN14614_c0_g2_i1.p1  ORF type:complete len:310 (+),score=47.42 TRINITY_DN14614_c0_g2_i1:216-1145(+)